jgi:hypothetical protein
MQELSVIFTTKLSSKELKLVSDPLKLSYLNLEALYTFIDQQKWRLFNLVKISQIASYESESNSSLNDGSLVSNEIKNFTRSPKIVASCFCHRKPGYYFFNAYFLIFLITISSITIFSVINILKFLSILDSNLALIFLFFTF